MNDHQLTFADPSKRFSDSETKCLEWSHFLLFLIWLELTFNDARQGWTLICLRMDLSKIEGRLRNDSLRLNNLSAHLPAKDGSVTIWCLLCFLLSSTHDQMSVSLSMSMIFLLVFTWAFSVFLFFSSRCRRQESGREREREETERKIVSVVVFVVSASSKRCIAMTMLKRKPSTISHKHVELFFWKNIHTQTKYSNRFALRPILSKKKNAACRDQVKVISPFFSGKDAKTHLIDECSVSNRVAFLESIF